MLEEQPGPPLIHIMTSSSYNLKNSIFMGDKKRTSVRIPSAFEEVKEQVLDREERVQRSCCSE